MQTPAPSQLTLLCRALDVPHCERLPELETPALCRYYAWLLGAMQAQHAPKSKALTAAAGLFHQWDAEGTEPAEVQWKQAQGAVTGEHLKAGKEPSSAARLGKEACYNAAFMVLGAQLAKGQGLFTGLGLASEGCLAHLQEAVKAADTAHLHCGSDRHTTSRVDQARQLEMILVNLYPPIVPIDF